MSHPDLVDFETLISPCTPDSFFSRYWRQRFLYQPGNSARLWRLFGLNDVDTLFSGAMSNPGDWFFFNAANNVDRATFTANDGQIQLNQLIALYRDGGTIHLRNIQRYLPRVEEFWRRLSTRFRTQVRINAWVTRENDFEPYLHYDTHDIFVLQVHGSKHWVLYERDPDLFAPRAGNVEIRRSDVGSPMREITVNPGDLLYIPAGMPHAVSTRERDSIHLAIGVFPVLWRDVLDDVLSELDSHGSILVDAVAPELLMAGQQNELLAALGARVLQAMGEIDERSLSNKLGSRFVDALTPPRDRHFLDEILHEQALDPSTQLRRRGGASAIVEVDEVNAVVRIRSSGGGAMEGPLALRSTLDAIADAEGVFSAAQLHSDYDIDSRVLLLSELLQRGFLERVCEAEVLT